MEKGGTTIRNIGMITAPEVAEDQWIAGAVIVTYDEHGNYGTIFRAGSLPGVPSPEIQEEIGSLIRHSWDIANTPGIEIEPEIEEEH